MNKKEFEKQNPELKSEMMMEEAIASADLAKENKNYKSRCCNASVKAVCSDKVPDNGSTWHYECEKCKKPCCVKINI